MNTPVESKEKNYLPFPSGKILLLIIIFIAIFLRIYSLGSESIWTDEAFTVIFSNSLKNICEGIVEEAHPPFYYIIMCFVLKMGDSEFISRLPSAIFGILTALLTCKLAWGSSKNLQEVIFVALLTGISASAIQISQMARMYSLECLLVLLCAYFLQESFRKDKIIYPAGYVISSTLLLYTHYTGFIFLFSVKIYYFIFWKETKKYIKKWIICQIAIALLFAPWLPVMFKQSSAGYGELLPTPDLKLTGDTLIHLIYGGLFSINPGFYVLILAPPFIIFYLGAGRNFNGRGRLEQFLPVVLFLLPLLLTLMISIFSHKKIFSSKHFFYSLPFFYIVLARGMEYINKKRKLLALTVLFLLLSFNLYSIYNRKFEEKFQNPDWRQGVKEMELLSQEGDLILVQDAFQAFAFKYYYKGDLPAFTVGKDNVPYDLHGMAASYRRIWLFRCQAWHSDPEGLVEKWLQENCTIKEHFTYFRIDRASLLTLTLYEVPHVRHEK